MTRPHVLALAFGLLATSVPAWAQPQTSAAPAAAASAGASTPALPALAGQRVDDSLQRRVIEDDGVRIEETRLRGAATHITVQSKLPGARPYQIQVAPAGRDRSEPRGGAGQRAWTLFDF
jgi:hypothetical protein